jgi:hypothetical protein
MKDKSETITKLAIALSKFQSEVPVIPKDGQAYGYKYAPLDTIIEHIRKPLAKHGLSFIHLVGDNGSVSCLLLHESGEYIQSDYITLPNDNSNNRTTPVQQMGSSITYAKRYTLSAMLGLATDEDNDGAKQAQQAKRTELKPGMAAWDKAVETIKAGKATVSQAESKYYITKENKNKLKSYEQN